MLIMAFFFPLLPAEMLESNNLVTFEGLANSSAYHTFLLDEEKGRLVVGAKDHIFSFNLLNVSRDYAQVKKQKKKKNTLVWFPVSPVRRFPPLSIYGDCEPVRVFRPTLISALSVPLRPECQSGAQVSRDFFSFLFRQKSASCIFQSRPVAHDHTLCQAC